MFKVREQDVDGRTNWLWIEKDSGGWDGPVKDWLGSHRDAINEFCKHRRVVVQAGGNQGLYPALLRDRFETVYTFEPDWMNFHCLSYNCCDERIVKFNCALSDRIRIVSLRRSAHLVNTGTHSTTDDVGNGWIPALTIDRLPLKQCDFIWLDVEGNEKLILQGAKQTIEKFKPVVFAENFKKHSDFMEELGYKYVRNTISDAIFIPK